jgi:hypothetical protein
MAQSLSVKIASARRELRRIEEDRPLFLKRIAGHSPAERELAIRHFEESCRIAKEKLDGLLLTKGQ